MDGAPEHLADRPVCAPPAVHAIRRWRTIYVSMPTLESSPIATAAFAFANEPLIAYGAPQNHPAMLAALERVKRQLGQTYGAAGAAESLRSTNPARPAEIVGIHAVADPAVVQHAIQTAAETFATWRDVPTEGRAAILRKAAALIRERKLEYCAWLVFEVGKNFGEADAEVAEAIDFLEFYALEALRLAASTTPIQYPGERNRLLHVPLGVVAVIPPWNFPFAILAGMTCAALVTGNTVVLKPSPEACTVAARFVLLLEECGLPAGVVNLCQGGPEVGSALVDSPRIAAIAFTGSMKVGLHIHAQAAQTHPGQHWIKRTILELGGKDGIVVAADADLDLAADGVIASAFGFSGQKCSACSRAIVERAVYPQFLDKLLERVARLKPGAPADNADIAPVINRAAYDRLLRYLELAAQSGRVVAGGQALTAPEEGYFIAPTIVADVRSEDAIAQEEIFGPLLAVVAADDFDNALRIANDTPYGLTGALYTRSPEKIEAARTRFHVGNLYFNRKCTGAMVGAHPFGGFKLSGTDSKAGGADYLHLFTQAKSIAERILP